MPVKASLFLRLGLAACFIGHGVLAIQVHEPWLAFFHVFGLGDDAGRVIMPVVGGLDVVVATLLAVRPTFLPFHWIVRWALLWTVFTALLRPLAGGDSGDVLVRATNWGPALALAVVPRLSAPVLVAAVACIVTALATGESVLPKEPGIAQWLERGGLLGIPLALFELLRWGKTKPPPHLSE